MTLLTRPAIPMPLRLLKAAPLAVLPALALMTALLAPAEQPVSVVAPAAQARTESSGLNLISEASAAIVTVDAPDYFPARYRNQATEVEQPIAQF